MAETLANMINAVCNERGWRSVGSLPSHYQYFVLNVKGGGLLESIGEDVYEKENPEWAKSIRDDYTKIVTEAEDAKKLHEAAEIANSDAVKFIAGLSDKQRQKLVNLLADEPEPVAEAVPVMAMCEKCGKEMPMLEAKLVDGKMVGKCSAGHDMEKPVEKPA